MLDMIETRMAEIQPS